MFIDSLVRQMYCVSHHVTYEEFPKTLQFNYNREPVETEFENFEDGVLLV